VVRRRFTSKIAVLQRRRQLQLVATDVDVQFFDRSPWCTVALALFLQQPVPQALAQEIARIIRAEVYESTVFFVRPLGFVTPTAARRISYEDSLVFEAVHEAVYRDYGFELVDVASGSVEQRAAESRHARPGAAQRGEGVSGRLIKTTTTRPIRAHGGLQS